MGYIRKNTVGRVDTRSAVTSRPGNLRQYTGTPPQSVQRLRTNNRRRQIATSLLESNKLKSRIIFQVEPGQGGSHEASKDVSQYEDVQIDNQRLQTAPPLPDSASESESVNNSNSTTRDHHSDSVCCPISHSPSKWSNLNPHLFNSKIPDLGYYHSVHSTLNISEGNSLIKYSSPLKALANLPSPYDKIYADSSDESGVLHVDSDMSTLYRDMPVGPGSHGKGLSGTSLGSIFKPTAEMISSSPIAAAADDASLTKITMLRTLNLKSASPWYDKQDSFVSLVRDENKENILPARDSPVSHIETSLLEPLLISDKYTTNRGQESSTPYQFPKRPYPYISLQNSSRKSNSSAGRRNAGGTSTSTDVSQESLVGLNYTSSIGGSFDPVILSDSDQCSSSSSDLVITGFCVKDTKAYSSPCVTRSSSPVLYEASEILQSSPIIQEALPKPNPHVGHSILLHNNAVASTSANSTDSSQLPIPRSEQPSQIELNKTNPKDLNVQISTIVKAYSSARSKKGCWTCRLRKKKCDEFKPACLACSRLGIQCDYSETRPEYMDNGPKSNILRKIISNQIKIKKLSG